MIPGYAEHCAERADLGIPPLPLNATQTDALVKLLGEGSTDPEHLQLMRERVPGGVDEAAYVKAAFLAAVARGEQQCPAISRLDAVFMLGTMFGGYNVEPLVKLLDDSDQEIQKAAVVALSGTKLVFDAYHDVTDRIEKNPATLQVVENWADATWFTARPPLAERLRMVVFKVPGEINTDDLSPAQDAFTRPDIPLHALAMLKNPREGMVENPLQTIAKLREDTGLPVVFVGDVVGTGSSRKSAANSLLWHIGDDIPFVPNKKSGGVVLGSKIAPIFFNTLEDEGTLPIECDVSGMDNGDVIEVLPYEGRIVRVSDGSEITRFQLRSEVILDEVQAGGRIPLIIGRGLSDRACKTLDRDVCSAFRRPHPPADDGQHGYTLAQKMIGRACGVEGVRPGTYCEPVITTVGSQDTTGPMTRDEMKDLACLGFGADLVMQSFCHTAAYPRPVDIENQHSLPEFFHTRGGVALQPGDGIIHSWLNRMLLPDTLGTGG